MVLGVLVADPLDVFNGSEELGMYLYLRDEYQNLSQCVIPNIL